MATKKMRENLFSSL